MSSVVSRTLAISIGVGGAALVALALGTCSTPAAPRASALTPARVASAGERSVTVFFTGSDDGYLDACGCDDGLLGGLPRRATLLKSLGGDNEEQSVLVSNGRLVAGTSPLDRMKLDTIVFAMLEMKYQAIALSERELALGRDQLAEIAGLLGDKCALLGTNLEDTVSETGSSAEASTPPPWQGSIVRDFGGRSVVVMSAVAPSRGKLFAAADPGMQVGDPAAALEAELDRRGDAWKVVVLGQMTVDEANALAKAFPRIDVLIVQGPEYQEHPLDEAITVGSTTIVTTGRKGKFIGTLRFGREGELDDYRPEAVHDQLEKRASIQDLIVLYYRDRLVEESPHPIDAYYEMEPAPNGAAYVGADEGSCASCHPKAWETWSKSRHARAWQTLVDQDLPPKPDDKKGHQRHAIWDPDCVRCHVTGFGKVGGYAGLEKEKTRDAPLVNVTCEACHGPAGDHAQRAQAGDTHSWPGKSLPRIFSADAAAKDPARALRDTPAAEALCMKCHDPDNSPAFDLREYWVGRVKGEDREPVKHGSE